MVLFMPGTNSELLQCWAIGEGKEKQAVLGAFGETKRVITGQML